MDTQPGLLGIMFHLNDAQEEARQWPERASVPCDDALAAIRVGQCVKVGIDRIEAFWVEVESVDGDKLAGRIVNQLVNSHIHGLWAGHAVTLDKRNVFAIAD
jgi:hypothetical protein